MLGAMRLIFITPPDAAFRQERAVAKQILRNHPHATLHVRKPGWGRAELSSYLEDVVGSAGAGQLVLHHHHDLMEGHPSIGRVDTGDVRITISPQTEQMSVVVGTEPFLQLVNKLHPKSGNVMLCRYINKGVHFPAYARSPPPFLPRNLGGTTSTSFHNLEEAASDQWGALDYAFLSPIFDSISKVGYPSAGFNPAAVAWTTQRGSVPLIALGGITAETVGQVAAMGFRGVAVIGTVWGADDPLLAAEAMQIACDAVTLQVPRMAKGNSRQSRK